jgi:hypothetical protein
MKKYLILAAFAMLVYGASTGLAGPTVLGTSQDFAVLGHTGVSNTGSTVITGNLGNYEAGANAIVGFNIAGNTFNGPGTFTDGPGIVNPPAQIYGGEAVALQARNDLITAYTALSSYGTATNMSGQVLGNGVGGTVPVLGPGVYSFSSSAQLNGTLQLDAGGINGGAWVFQISSTLTTASASAIEFINAGSNNGSDVGVFWLVGSSATLGTTTAFEGNILALTDITMNTGATIDNGRALAQYGAVTLDTNTISNRCPYPNLGPGFSGGLEFNESGGLVPINPTIPAVVPVPGAILLVGSGLMSLFTVRKKLLSAI